MLESQRGELIGSDHDFNTILKVFALILILETEALSVCTDVFILYIIIDLQHINELTMKLDLQGILRGAEAIYLQLVQCKVRKASQEEVSLSTDKPHTHQTYCILHLMLPMLLPL